MKFLFTLLFLMFTSTHANDKAFHDFSIESISGEMIKFSDFKSNVVLLVNTASKCGFTPQYSGLQKIYERYKDDGLVVLGVPTNDFNQENLDDVKVGEFCKKNYGGLKWSKNIF